MKRMGGKGRAVSALVAVLVGSVMAAGLVVLLSSDNLQAAESNSQESCLSCHPRELEFHDQLGPGNKACGVCHSTSDMKMLRLVDGTPLSLAEHPQVCAQCHQNRYDAWKEGTHGIPGPSSETCTACHDPHQPQVALAGITKVHPLPQSPPDDASTALLIMLGISAAFVVAVGFAVVRKGESP